MHRIIHTFKKILQLLFNRIFYVAVALMLQLAWLTITVWRLAAYSKYISNTIGIISVLVVLWIVNKKNQSVLQTWLDDPDSRFPCFRRYAVSSVW